MAIVYRFADNQIAERTAKSLKLQAQSIKLENFPYDFELAFRTIAAGDPQMLLVLSSNRFVLHRTQIAEHAASPPAYHVQL